MKEPGEAFREEHEKIAAKLAELKVEDDELDNNENDANKETDEGFGRLKEGQLKFTKLLNDAKAHGRKTKTIIDDVEKNFGLKLTKLNDYPDPKEEAATDL